MKKLSERMKNNFSCFASKTKQKLINYKLVACKVNRHLFAEKDFHLFVIRFHYFFLFVMSDVNP